MDGPTERAPLSADPLPASGAWRPGDPVAARRFVTIATERPFALEGGGALRDITLAFETWGTLDADAGNAVLVCHALTGDAHAAGPSGPGQPTSGWWDGLIGPGRGARHRPLLRGVRQRARRLPGLDRAVVDRRGDR